MKLFLLIVICLALTTLFAPSVAQKRIKLVKKGYYPDLVAAASRQRDPTRKYTQKATKKEQKKEELPSYFETNRPESLEGWLSKPKATAPKSSVQKKASTDKDGFCGNTAAYGIQCGARMDQCRKDSDCPGVTKCCLVSDCGFLCVKPKAKAKQDKILKKKMKIKDLETMESVTTAQGLKIEDITKMPEV